MAELINMPKLGFDMAEGTLVRWIVKEGETIEKGVVLAEIETDKATVEVESMFEGVLSRHLVTSGDIVPVNTPIAVIAAPDEEVDYQDLLGESVEASDDSEADGKESPEPAATTRNEDEPESGDMFPGGVRASPVARRIAEEHSVDIRRIEGSGPGGRIVKRDVETYLESPPAPIDVEKKAIPTSLLPTVPSWSPTGQPPEDKVVPLNRLRAIIGRRMTDAKQNVPHFYVTSEFDMAKLVELREQVNAMLPDGEKTSINDYILKATALALREFPNLNASIGDDEIIHHGAVNIGVAVAVENGLLTVVCRDADRKQIRQISNEVRMMAKRARDGKVRPEDIDGSTFSLSNMGMFDVEHFLAIINPPEAAILAVGSVLDIPVIVDGSVVPGVRMKATISVDHRVSDGAEAARFMQSLAKYLEQPLSLLV